MPVAPIITFKAGICEVDFDHTPPNVFPKPTPGYIYLYQEDDLPHFCWRPRTAPLSEAQLDLIMFPGDGTFKPYEPKSEAGEPGPATNGRIYVLKFSSSSDRHLFWMQSKTQHPSGDVSWFSPRDLKLGQIVNQVLQGEEIDVQQEITNLPSGGGGPNGDDDATMEDAEGSLGADLHRAASGGAGAGATGGDIREEGEESREGGADGGRAAAPAQTQTEAAVANFLKSLQGNQALDNEQARTGKPFTTLPDLLTPSTTLPIVDNADEAYLDLLLSHLPPTLVLLSSGAEDTISLNPDPETVEAVMMSLSPEQKKNIIKKVLYSPQFTQSLSSLTMALSDGELPVLSETLKISVANGGYIPQGRMPLRGGAAVEALLEGIKKAAEKDSRDEGRMDTE